MQNSDRQALVDFLLDIDCLKPLEGRGDDVNLFDILKITNREIRHSNILAWFFDPNESHMMGDDFIRAFVSCVVKYCKAEIDPFKYLMQDFFSYQVLREANDFDIVLYSKKESTVIIIENKVWSGEGKNQLNNYLERARQIYSDCDKMLFVFLTPEGREASNTSWISVSYRDIVDILSEIRNHHSLTDEVNLITDNYIKTVRKNIMDERDEELYTLCNEIYNKHKAALRLIFDNVKIDNSFDTDIISGVLMKLAADGRILYAPEYRLKFFTPEMDKLLPRISENKSSWGTNYTYCFWLEKTSDSLVIHFELGSYGTNEAERKLMEDMVVASQKKKQNGLSRFNRLYYKKQKLNEVNYETSLQNATDTLVNAVLKWQKDILTKINIPD